MNRKMDISFWVPAIGGVILTVGGASLGLWSAISAHNDSIKDKVRAELIASEHKKLLEQNYQKSLSIIEELNKSAEKTKVLLDNTNEVIRSQKESSVLLTDQVKTSSMINSSILESGEKVVSTINLASKNMDDNLTGGDSYCTIEIVNAGKRVFRLGAINKFQNNIPNVILKIENYSAIEKCGFTEIEDVKRINYDCYTSNSSELGPMVFNTNTNYFIGGDQFINTSGKQGKLRILMLTPKNKFSVQIIYQVKTDTHIEVLYRVLKQTNGKYIPIYSNDDQSDSNNPARWDAFFPLPVELPISQ